MMRIKLYRVFAQNSLTNEREDLSKRSGSLLFVDENTDVEHRIRDTYQSDDAYQFNHSYQWVEVDSYMEDVV